MFAVKQQKNGIRIGKIKTRNGAINTPFFMPDATRGFIRSLGKNDLEKIKVGPMVVNTYHLYLQPGMEAIKKAKGINQFMDWPQPLLSDSGGYQVFSLIHKNPELGKIMDDKVVFRSPLDGSKHELTPEKAIRIQFDLGVDMLVCLDDPPPNTDSKEKIKKAVERTLAWAKRCKDEYNKQIKKRKLTEKNRPLIFGVIQGGEHLDLRRQCTEGLVRIGFDGYGFGARHVDKDGNFLDKVLKYTASLIPADSLRFALGIGTPVDIVRCAQMGWDMFDCVIPTRDGRHGKLFIWKKSQPAGKDFYETLNINNGRYKNDFTPLDKKCACELCRNHTRAYLRHLFASKDPLAMRLASIHNLRFYMELMEKLRGAQNSQKA